MHTIRRNTKEMERVLGKARFVKVYILSNGFKSTPLHLLKDESIRQYLVNLLRDFSFAKLIDDGNGKYRLRVHSNEWYEFQA